MHTTIVGTKSLEHLAENLRTVAVGPLALDVYRNAKQRLKQIGQVPA